jgi:D-sedoheptulose 7-phosphate isomerase
MDRQQYYRDELAEHAELMSLVGAMDPTSIDGMLAAAAETLDSNGKILFFGNGGSAADAQHLATELTVRYRINRRALGAIALTTDTSTLTAVGNDFGFDDLFARQVEGLCRPGDLAVGLTTSGNSENVIRGLAAARARGARTLALTGGRGGRVLEYADYAVIVPSTTTARIQEMHILIGHILCGWVEATVAGKLS